MSVTFPFTVQEQHFTLYTQEDKLLWWCHFIQKHTAAYLRILTFEYIAYIQIKPQLLKMHF